MTLRYPVALWQDAEGSYTACLLDGPQASAIDATASGALVQLKRFLSWSMRQGELLAAPDFERLQLRDHRVRIRPEYQTDDGAVFPVSMAVTLRVACVHGRRRDGSPHCVIPTLGLRFSHQAEDEVGELVVELVQQVLGKKSPQELSRELMPSKILLDAVHTAQREPARRGEATQFPALESVAEPLGRRGGRSGRALEREREVQAVVKLLTTGQANVLLLGQSGVGKTTVLTEAIRLKAA